jgi:hypothetical protein
VSLLKIDDSESPCPGFSCAVVVKTRVRMLVVLSPPLLAELAARRLAPLDVHLVMAADDTPVPAGHYDAVLRNVPLPPDVSGDLVVDLPPPAGTPPVGGAFEDQVVLDRLDDVAGVLVRRFFGESS